MSLNLERDVYVCPPDHRHAEVGTCYGHHGCRCGPCRVAKTARKHRTVSQRVSCERCGVARVVRSGRGSLWCADCRSVESDEMREAWAA